MSRWGIWRGRWPWLTKPFHLFSKRRESCHPCACRTVDSAPGERQTTEVLLLRHVWGQRQKARQHTVATRHVDGDVPDPGALRSRSPLQDEEPGKQQRAQQPS
jgi:hypothetical protein